MLNEFFIWCNDMVKHGVDTIKQATLERLQMIINLNIYLSLVDKKLLITLIIETKIDWVNKSDSACNEYISRYMPAPSKIIHSAFNR